MRVTLLWPIGPSQPGDVVDVDPRLGDVLAREGFARVTEGPAVPFEPAGPTVAEVRQYAADHKVPLMVAKRLMAADQHARA